MKGKKEEALTIARQMKSDGFLLKTSSDIPIFHRKKSNACKIFGWIFLLLWTNITFYVSFFFA